jgi:beta-glucosidase-like glycosyl hydrolase/CubicO group peptidase (beta-lactamase class C family)
MIKLLFQFFKYNFLTLFHQEMKYVYFLFSFFFFLQIFSQELANPLVTKDSVAQKQWVDTLYSKMTLEEKVGQLFMVDVFSKEPRKDIQELIEKYHIGGIIFSKGGPVRQAVLTNKYQSKSKTPLLIAMDAEWGLSMRLDSTYAFPWNMTLGAIKDTLTVKAVATQIAKHCKRLGVHINFAPVVDLNTNPKNPIIGNRSFGENKYDVTEKAKAFVQAFDEQGILSSAKHFPGHGDTDLDSHKTLPTLNFTRQRLDSVEMYPFKQLLNSKLSSVMVAHLNVPSLEGKYGLPTSLSKTVITDLLKKELGYKGLIFTDALNMKGASNYKKPGEIDLQAFLAGNDILLIPENVPKAVSKIIEAYNNGIIKEERLEHSVKKILLAKYKSGLHKYKYVDIENLYEDLNGIENDAVYMKAIAEAVTVIKNDKGVLPFKNLDKQKIAYLKMGDDDSSTFLEVLNLYDTVVSISNQQQLNEKIDELKAYDMLIVGHHTSNENPWKSFAFTDRELVALHEISLTIPTVLVNFSSPYALNDIRSFTNLKAIVQAYQNSNLAQSATAQILFGARPAKGKLPVGVKDIFPVGTGFSYDANGRLAYGFSHNQGMDPNFEKEIDDIVQYAIEKEMTPGAQLLVAKNGVAIYKKSFGYHTNEKRIEVKPSDIYDLASLTKILSSLPLFMKLEEEQKISVNDSLYQHVPELIETNKASISFKKMLSHYARLRAWIPFYAQTLKNFDLYYNNKKDDVFNVEVARDLYTRKDYRDTINFQIYDSELRKSKEYKYSDLPYYILKNVIEKYNNAPLNETLSKEFYDKMGINSMSYLPLEKFDALRIVPTEYDKVWRKQLLRGYVHDQGAALLGGVGGHAGLFGNANDVAKFMQMYLNGGVYGDVRLLKKETIDTYNTCNYCDEEVRRGIGFDKPQLGVKGPTCGCVPMNSFGHSGFTGTYTWADPEHNIVYVFLSNRIHPTADNKGLINENIRTKIQEVIYNHIIE